MVRRLVPPLLALRERTLPFTAPWLEAAGAVAFGILAGRFGAEPGGWPLYAFTLLLLAVCATDYLVKLIPDLLTLGGVAAGVAASTLVPDRLVEPLSHRWLVGLLGLSVDADLLLSGLVLSLSGAALGFLVLDAIRRVFGLLLGLEPMGLGDARLAAAIGAFLGPQGVVFAVGLAFLLGVVHGIVMQRVTGLPHAPFGPPLAAAAWLVAVVAEPLLAVLAAGQAMVLRLPLWLLAGGYVLLLAVAVGLILRLRRRAAHYEAIIEDDYQRLEERLEPVDDKGDDVDTGRS
ncbi:MAG: A24 family peptidase [Acidobacteriota bacterium]